MTDAELHRAILRALDRARPGTVVLALQKVLAEHLGAREVQLLLADYQLTTLCPVHDPENPVAIDGSDAGRAFITQSPIVSYKDIGGDAAYLPMTVHGDPIGVLRVTLSDKMNDDILQVLTDVATLTGYALSATSRHNDFLHRATRSRRLILAAELQWQLLPAHGCISSEYQLAGLLKPANAVHADTFDWSEETDNLTISITDGSPNGGNHPLLTTLAVTAIRNARRAGFAVTAQFEMANEAIYAHHVGKPWVSSLVVSIDVTTGHARAIQAGSSQTILLRRGEIHTLDLIDQMPLGMFEGTVYEEQSFDLATGDRLLLLSDGVLDALSARGEPYRNNRLRRVLGKLGQHNPTTVVRAIIDDLIEHHQEEGLDDDATVVCLDWSGPGASSVLRITELGASLRETNRHLHAVPETNGLDDRPRTIA